MGHFLLRLSQAKEMLTEHGPQASCGGCRVYCLEILQGVGPVEVYERR